MIIVTTMMHMNRAIKIIMTAKSVGIIVLFSLLDGISMMLGFPVDIVMPLEVPVDDDVLGFCVLVSFFGGRLADVQSYCMFIPPQIILHMNESGGHFPSKFCSIPCPGSVHSIVTLCDTVIP